jgi:hypothetical protein
MSYHESGKSFTKYINNNTDVQVKIASQVAIISCMEQILSSFNNYEYIQEFTNDTQILSSFYDYKYIQEFIKNYQERREDYAFMQNFLFEIGDLMDTRNFNLFDNFLEYFDLKKIKDMSTYQTSSILHFSVDYRSKLINWNKFYDMAIQYVSDDEKEELFEDLLI